MPTLNKNFTLTVTPEQFLQACSREELIELDMLLGSSRFQKKMQQEPRQITIHDIIEEERYLEDYIPANPPQTKGAST